MKQCPFCGADIEDNAQFCLYCMTSLTEKEQISSHPNRKSQGLLILAILVGVFFILAFLFFGIQFMQNRASQSDTPGTTLSSDPTETITAPTTQATTMPETQATTESTEPTEAETEPAKPASKPSSKPTTDTSKPTQPTPPAPPASEPTQPTSPPTQPGTESTESHVHSFHLKNTSEEFLMQRATCESPAYYYFSCICGARCESYFQSGSPGGHTPEIVKGKPADCLYNGYTDSTICSVCKLVLEEKEILWSPGHEYTLSSSLNACWHCGEMRTITIITPPLPTTLNDQFRINSGHIRILYDTFSEIHFVTLIFNYTNISSETTYGHPLTTIDYNQRGGTLAPNESGTFFSYCPVYNPYNTLYVEFI